MELTAKNQFIETSNQTIENTEKLTLRFLHFFRKMEKERIMAIFCTIYYILSYIYTIPQILKLIKTKSSNDYSLGMITLQLIALISWSLYIFTSIQSIVVYIGTIIDLLLLLFVDFLILKYYKFKGADSNE
ncbi:MAG: PQ-loop repeat-containing protein [Clostridia bacterium]|nr:PQ-loop repeat-containing protein [Clostridia bacterium]